MKLCISHILFCSTLLAPSSFQSLWSNKSSSLFVITPPKLLIMPYQTILFAEKGRRDATFITPIDACAVSPLYRWACWNSARINPVCDPVEGHKARRGRRLYSNPGLSKLEQGSCYYCPWNDLAFYMNQVAFILGKLRKPFQVCFSCETFWDTQSSEMASPCSDS